MNPVEYKSGDVTITKWETENSLSMEVRTNRLRIVSVTTDEYTPQLIDLYGSQAVNRFVGLGGTLKQEQVIEKINRWKSRWAQKNPFTGFVILEQGTNDFVGQIILKRVKDRSAGSVTLVPGLAEIGYLSAERHWNKKYCQEYTRAFLDELVPFLIRSNTLVAGQPLTSVMATARVDNVASNCVLRKFMNYTGRRDRYNGPREWYERKYV